MPTCTNVCRLGCVFIVGLFIFSFVCHSVPLNIQRRKPVYIKKFEFLNALFPSEMALPC